MPLVISAGVILIAFGLMCVFDKNTTWVLYEHDARLFGRVIRRDREWEALMTTQGIVLVMIGIMGVIVGLR
jgi:hypothetical protein